ncbi:MAG: MoxR family ATPase [Myxococcales bacterium]|nr:MoxR family ATPase [Myxococcota bacterium]MDW8283454.1 MoxR family ATPase [Myxococcales bacterium]
MATAQTDEAARLGERFAALRAEVAKVLVGQEAMVHRLLLGILAGGHVLLEGVPGLAKTLVVRTLAACIDASFSRIQFTPDMLPGDVTGTQVYNPRDGSYTIKKGPIFGNLVLADEINRAPAKVQAALLEAMQERQVTLGEQTFRLEEPFLVLATQNPIEQEGTYPLPEAQLDRFLMKVRVTYPSREEELKIIDRMAGPGAEPKVNRVMTPADILSAREAVRQVFVDDKVKRYVVDLVTATRDPVAAKLPQLKSLIEYGASVRASINLVKVAKANALLAGRNYISPHDVKTIAHDVLRHRILVTYEAEAEEKTSDHIISTILENIEVP